MKSNESKKDLYLFLFCLVVSSLYVDWSFGWNTVSRVAMPLNLALTGELNINPYAQFTGDKALINELYYSDKAPLPGFLLTPLLYILSLFCNIEHWPPVQQLKTALFAGGIVLGALPFSLSILQVKQMLRGMLPVWLILLFFFSSFLFAFAGTAFSHCLAGLLLLLSFNSFRNKRGWQSGLWIGAAFCTEYSIAVFGFFWAAYWLLNKHWRLVLWLIVGALPFVVFQAAYNFYLTGSALDFAYKFQENFAMNAQNYGFTRPSLTALWHITFSSYRGLFFYAPLLIPLFFYKRLKSKSFWASPEAFALMACLFYTLLFSMSKSWYMGWTFGPRYLYTSALLLFSVLGLGYCNNILKPWQKISAIGIGAASFLHVWLAKVIFPYPPTNILFPAQTFLWPKLLESNFYQYHLLHLLDFPSLYAAILLLISVPALIIWAWHFYDKAQ